MQTDDHRHRYPQREPMKSFRVNLELWRSAVMIAELRHESVSGVLRSALRTYVRRHSKLLAQLPQQEAEEAADQDAADEEDEADN